MEKQHPINEMMSTTMEKIRSMMDANTIIGDPIQTGEVTLIPVSRLSFGFASGGSDFVTKNQKPGAENTFGGGSGASAKMEPVAFLITRGTASSCSRSIHLPPPRWTGSSRWCLRWWKRSPIFWKSRKKQTSPRRERTTLWCDRTDLTEFAGSGRERKPAARKILRSLCLMEGDHIETTAGDGAGRWIYALPGAHCPGGGHLRVLCHPDGGRERPGAL